eukprot:gene10208-8124_t
MKRSLTHAPFKSPYSGPSLASEKPSTAAASNSIMPVLKRRTFCPPLPNSGSNASTANSNNRKQDKSSTMPSLLLCKDTKSSTAAASNVSGTRTGAKEELLIPSTSNLYPNGVLASQLKLARGAVLFGSNPDFNIAREVINKLDPPVSRQRCGDVDLSPATCPVSSGNGATPKLSSQKADAKPTPAEKLDGGQGSVQASVDGTRSETGEDPCVLSSEKKVPEARCISETVGVCTTLQQSEDEPPITSCSRDLISQDCQVIHVGFTVDVEGIEAALPQSDNKIDLTGEFHLMARGQKGRQGVLWKVAPTRQFVVNGDTVSTHKHSVRNAQRGAEVKHLFGKRSQVWGNTALVSSVQSSSELSESSSHKKIRDLPEERGSDSCYSQHESQAADQARSLVRQPPIDELVSEDWQQEGLLMEEFYFSMEYDETDTTQKASFLAPGSWLRTMLGVP